MKLVSILLLLTAIFLPVFTMGQESLRTDRVQATFQNNGGWELTDTLTGITWYGQWISESLMKVSGTDNLCFVIGKNESGMIQLNCRDLTQISILLAYKGDS